MHKKLLCCVALAFCALVAQGQNSTQKQQSTTPPRHISSAGCTEPGVEGGCVVLRGFKDQKLYNLFFAGDKPAFDTAISFEGTEHEGPTTCMQGLAVDVTKWTPLKMKCPKEKEGSAKDKK